MNFLGKYKRTLFYLTGIFLALTAGVFVYIYNRYHVENEMTIQVKEYTQKEYPDNPAPLKESYSVLINNPPEKSPVFSVLVNEKNKWINHHEIAIDGSYLFLDKNQPNRLHLYLVSYERHAVVAHYWMDLPQS